MPKIIAIIHGRMSSSRLPGKVLKDLAGKTVFYHHVERMRQCPKVEEIYLGTSKDTNNQPLIDEAKKLDVPFYAGSSEDVVERYITIARKAKADMIVRCGCDKPLFSYEIVNALIENYREEDLLFTSNPLGRGIGSEIISLEALEKIHKHYHGPAIAKYIREYPHLFKVKGVKIDDELSRPEFRLTLDFEEDYKLIGHIYDKFYTDKTPVDIRKVFLYLDDNPEMANINRFAVEKQINVYLRDLENKPIIAVYRQKDGKVVVKNRMEEIISRDEFESAVKRLEWE